MPAARGPCRPPAVSEPFSLRTGRIDGRRCRELAPRSPTPTGIDVARDVDLEVALTPETGRTRPRRPPHSTYLMLTNRVTSTTSESASTARRAQPPPVVWDRPYRISIFSQDPRRPLEKPACPPLHPRTRNYQKIGLGSSDLPLTETLRRRARRSPRPALPDLDARLRP